MEGYHLRSRSVPPDTQDPDDVPPPPLVVSHPTTEGPVDESVPVGQCLVSAERPEAGVPSLGTQEHLISSGRSGTTLTVLLTDPPYRKSLTSAPWTTKPKSRTWRRGPTLMSGQPLAYSHRTRTDFTTHNKIKIKVG